MDWGVTEPNILDTHMVRTMRAVKRSVINLVNTFAERVVDVTVLVRFPLLVRIKICERSF